MVGLFEKCISGKGDGFNRDNGNRKLDNAKLPPLSKYRLSA
jgi:hypothetical protein